MNLIIVRFSWSIVDDHEFQSYLPPTPYPKLLPDLRSAEAFGRFHGGRTSRAHYRFSWTATTSGHLGWYCFCNRRVAFETIDVEIQVLKGRGEGRWDGLFWWSKYMPWVKNRWTWGQIRKKIMRVEGWEADWLPQFNYVRNIEVNVNIGLINKTH